MNRQKFLSIAIVFLLVLNIGILGYLYLERPKNPPKLWRQVIKVTRFDSEQQTDYLKLRDEHRKTMNSLDAKFAETLYQYFALLQHQDIDTTQQNLLTNRLAKIEKQKAEITWDHFRQVRALCSSDQIKMFDAMLPQLTQILLPPKKTPPHRRK